MITLEEAIELAERAYKESHNGLQYALKRGETKFAERCKKDAEEHRQLVEWLRELRERRKMPEIIYCKDCNWNDGTCYCIFHYRNVKANDHCSWAERRTDD